MHFLAPELYRQLESASERQLRKVALAACRFALARSGLESPRIDEAMGYLQRGEPVPQTLLASLEELVKTLDDKYFELRDKSSDKDSEDAEWMRFFEKARAAATVQFACGQDSLTAAAQAVYEANYSTRNETARAARKAELRPSLRAIVVEALAAK